MSGIILKNAFVIKPGPRKRDLAAMDLKRIAEKLEDYCHEDYLTSDEVIKMRKMFLAIDDMAQTLAPMTYQAY